MKGFLTLLALGGVILWIASFVSLVTGREDLEVPVLATTILAMVSMGYLMFVQVFPRFIFRVSKEQLAENVRVIRASGDSLATVTTGGRLGRVDVSGPLIRATAYPGGIVIKPVLLSTFGILAAEISAVEFTRALAGLGGKRLTIAHRSRQIASPVLLWCAEDHPFVTALQGIAPSTAAR